VYNSPVWRQFLRQPQRVWLRRACFQIHLWAGLGLGLYLVVLSLSGSALVYRNELDRFFATPRPRFDANAARLNQAQLRAAATSAYPGWAITHIGDRVSRRNPTIEIRLERADEKKQRLFNPYTGKDLGDSITKGEFFVLWLVRLHDELLFDRAGRYWNGVGSAIMTVLVITGLVVWWPGVNRWRRSLIIKTASGWRRFNWDLHSAIGFWLFLFMLMWGVSGVYLGIPQPFADLVDAVSDPTVEYGERWGDIALLWLTRLHFGRWRNAPVLKAAWAVLGLVPALMLITGAIMWWQRVVRRRIAAGTEAVWPPSSRRPARSRVVGVGDVYRSSSSK